MYVPNIELHECDTLAEASALLSRHAEQARLLAGGTDLLVDLKTGRLVAQHLIHIKSAAELRGVTLADGELRIGAFTTITELDRSPIVRERFVPLRDATTRMAAPQIRNLATVGGNLASAVPCADLPPILMVLGGSVVVWTGGITRRVPVDAFFVGVRRTALKPGEIVLAIVVPTMPKGFGAAYARFSLREGNAIAVASVAASLRLGAGDRIDDAHLALGAVSPTPQSVDRIRSVLVGRTADAAAFTVAAECAMAAARPISDVRGSAEFRRELVGILTRRAFQTALMRARENQ